MNLAIAITILVTSQRTCDREAHDSLSREGLFGAFLGGRAIRCNQGPAGIDLVIPMAVLGAKAPSAICRFTKQSDRYLGSRGFVATLQCAGAWD